MAWGASRGLPREGQGSDEGQEGSGRAEASGFLLPSPLLTPCTRLTSRGCRPAGRLQDKLSKQALGVLTCTRTF